MTGKEAELMFRIWAFNNGYKKKVVGEYAYWKLRKGKAVWIKLVSAKFGKLQIYEEGVGRYEIKGV